jgi:hypothetical protein
MSQKFNKNDTVFVPSSKFKQLEEYPNALYQTAVVDTNKKSIKVNLPNGVVSNFVGSSIAHSNTGIIIITIGDMETELTLLEPLKKTVLQFSRLLLDDSFILSLSCRSVEELKILWTKYYCSYSYLILIGHGSKNSLNFAVNQSVKANELIKIIESTSCSAKHIISLCCNTGYKEFASTFSNSKMCLDFMAPFQSIHGAEASQFIQTFLVSHLLEGKSTSVAFKQANDMFASKKKFRLWVNGKLK